MTLLAIFTGVLAAVYAFTIIEKKRGADGVLAYPIWRCNLFVFWGVSTLVWTALIGAVGLPKFMGIAAHGERTTAEVTSLSEEAHCRVVYRYRASGASFTDSDSFCGLKPGDRPGAYYDRLAPQNSTLYLPGVALKNESAATLLISAALAAAMALWFRATYIIGKPEKP